MTRLRASIVLALLVPLASLPVASGVAQNTVKAPKAGLYEGPLPHNAVLSIAGRTVELAAVSFPCNDQAWGRTSINDFTLKRTSRGYRFNADANGIVSYSDGSPDQNGAVHISGRFALDGKTVRGHVRVKTKRCGETDDLKWRAAR